MSDATEFAFRASRAWLNAWFTGADAMMTIACRTPVVTADPTGPESRRMVNEKVIAASQAAIAASFEVAGLALRPARPRDGFAAANAALGIAEAAAKPVRRRVKANARRLSGRKRKG